MVLFYFCNPKMVAIAQLVRASDCDSEGRGFEPHWLPNSRCRLNKGLNVLIVKVKMKR